MHLNSVEGDDGLSLVKGLAGSPQLLKSYLKEQGRFLPESISTLN